MSEETLRVPDPAPGTDPDELNYQIVGLIDKADNLAPVAPEDIDIKKQVIDLLAKASGLLALYECDHDDLPAKETP